MKKRGFSLIIAIIFLVLIATLGMLSMSFSASTQKQTTDTYLKEQASLLAISATKYAIMAMQKHDYNGGNCLETIKGVFPNKNNYLFSIQTDIYYFGNLCSARSTHNLDINRVAINTPESKKTAIINVVVTTNPAITANPIRYEKITLQKP